MSSKIYEHAVIELDATTMTVVGGQAPLQDVLNERGKQGWRHEVVLAGEGIVRWDEVAQGLKECNFRGTISLHGEYETKDLAERKQLAKRELEFLKNRLS